LALLLAAAFTWVEQRGFVVEYPPATAVLRWGAILGGLLAALELWRALTPSPGWSRRAARTALCAVAVLFGLAAFGTGSEQASVLLGRGYSGLSLGVLRFATDWDRDGHSAWFGGRDCAAFNAKVGPTAREIPGNGRDDNCRGGDLPAPPAGPGPTLGVPEPVAPKTPPPMSVVYITVDTVGVQHLGAYGYRRETTNVLDDWAKERAVTFEQAYTSGSSTTLVLGSNFRGVYPRRLQWSRVVKTRSGKFLPFENGEPPAALEGERVHRIYRLPATEPRAALPFWLGRRGLRTMAVSAVHFVAEDSHLVGRFDQQVALTEDGSKEPDDRGATDQALTWLAAIEPGERYFLWVHYLGPHSPSTHAAGVKDFGKGLLNEYDHELATFDDRLAPLLKELSKRQDGGEALTVMISADHGEEFRQHRFHGHSVAEGTAHIPLFVSMPGVAARRTSALASSVDIFPTVLALTGSEGPAGLDGRDLTPVVNGSVASWDRVVLMDGWVNDTNDGLPFNRVAAIGTERRMSWDLLNFAEDARDLPSLASGSHGTTQDSALREALTNYLERVQVDPRTSD
jgi:arylsulfatase A-like enzyme